MFVNTTHRLFRTTLEANVDDAPIVPQTLEANVGDASARHAHELGRR
jgi:hypothetical protein